VADVPHAASVKAAHMRIAISVQAGPPPSGVVSVDGGPEVGFDGWLSLLRLLADALHAETPPGAAGGLGGEVAPRGDAELGERV
jgi:hypothetical protein